MKNPYASHYLIAPVFIGGLTWLLIAMKLVGYIDWSWWAVLSPVWITVVFMALITTALIALAWLVDLFDRYQMKRR